MSELRLGWVLLPYLGVFLGLVILQSAWGALVGFHLALLPVILPRWQTISTRFFAPVAVRVILPVAIAGLFAGLGMWLVWPHVGLPKDFPARIVALGLSGQVWPFFIAYFTLVNPWLEEAYWREVLASPSAYPALVDFLFSGYHLIILGLFVGPVWILTAFVILAFAAWAWRQVSRYTGSLLPVVFSHMLADLSLLLVLYSKA